MNPIDGILHIDNTNERISRFEQCFQEQRSKSVNAVFYIESSLLEEMLDTGEFDTALLEDIGMESIENKIPLQYLVKCWDIILRPHTFKLETQPKIERMRRRNERIKALFKERLGIDIDAMEIRFWEMRGIIRLSYADETVEDVLDKTMEQFLAEGFKREDVLLFCESLKFNAPEVEKLLKAGADCDALFDLGDEEVSAANWVNTEVGYLCTEVLWMLLDYHEKSCYPFDIQGALPLGGFFSWAAYEQISQLFDKYDNSKKSKK